MESWLPDGCSQIFRSYVFGPSGFWTMAPLRYTAKFDPSLSPHPPPWRNPRLKSCHLATLIGIDMMKSVLVVRDLGSPPIAATGLLGPDLAFPYCAKI